MCSYIYASQYFNICNIVVQSLQHYSSKSASLESNVSVTQYPYKPTQSSAHVDEFQCCGLSNANQYIITRQ